MGWGRGTARERGCAQPARGSISQGVQDHGAGEQPAQNQTKHLCYPSLAHSSPHPSRWLVAVPCRLVHQRRRRMGLPSTARKRAPPKRGPTRRESVLAGCPIAASGQRDRGLFPDVPRHRGKALRSPSLALNPAKWYPLRPRFFPDHPSAPGRVPSPRVPDRTT